MVHSCLENQPDLLICILNVILITGRAIEYPGPTNTILGDKYPTSIEYSQIKSKHRLLKHTLFWACIQSEFNSSLCEHYSSKTPPERLYPSVG